MTFDDEVVAKASKGDSGGGMFLEYEGLIQTRRQVQLHSDKLNPIWNIRQSIPTPTA